MLSVGTRHLLLLHGSNKGGRGEEGEVKRGGEARRREAREEETEVEGVVVK